MRFRVKMMLCCLCSKYFDINIFWTNIELPFTPPAAENISKYPQKNLNISSGEALRASRGRQRLILQRVLDVVASL